MEKQKIAIIRIRGLTGIRKPIADTMKMLRLYNKNNCVVVDSTPDVFGMINKVKDYITWGEIDNETFKLLLEKRGKVVGDKPLTEEYLKDKTKVGFDGFVSDFFAFKIKLRDVPGMKLYFRLKPPVGGFERKGTKKPFSMGGVLGYRKEKINVLIKKML